MYSSAVCALDECVSLAPAHPVQRCEDVFILYCNDSEMPGDFLELIEELAALLVRTCGRTMKIHIDLYLSSPPGNWTRWTEERITESDVVLFVCSPTLIKMLSERHSDRPVPMKLGHFDAETVYNLIKSPKFVPIFLHGSSRHLVAPDLYAEPYSVWIPSKLLGTSRYWVDLEGLHRVIGETGTEEEYRDRVAHVLTYEQQKDVCIAPIAELLRSLQRTPATQPPPPFPTPIEVPPAGTCMYMYTVHVHVHMYMYNHTYMHILYGTICTWGCTCTVYHLYH